ncbi:MAG: type II toxin-antitoxin system YoeB family toxin [Ruminococcus sp.]|nr:type II toxin-antitoxin system YoeB family toxin [Ruminococcus sp.]
MNKLWSDIAWDESLYWQQTDKKIVGKINDLIKDIERNGLNKGIGHPQPLVSITAFPVLSFSI